MTEKFTGIDSGKSDKLVGMCKVQMGIQPDQEDGLH